MRHAREAAAGTGPRAMAPCLRAFPKVILRQFSYLVQNGRRKPGRTSAARTSAGTPTPPDPAAFSMHLPGRSLTHRHSGPGVMPFSRLHRRRRQVRPPRASLPSHMANAEMMKPATGSSLAAPVSMYSPTPRSVEMLSNMQIFVCAASAFRRASSWQRGRASRPERARGCRCRPGSSRALHRRPGS